MSLKSWTCCNILIIRLIGFLDYFKAVVNHQRNMIPLIISDDRRLEITADAGNKAHGILLGRNLVRRKSTQLYINN